MVRYPDTASVTATENTITDGEFASASSETTSITGRLQTSGSPKKIRQETGDYVETSTVFFTQAEKIDNADKLTVDGKTYQVILWEEKQSHSKIWLA